jgi:hypothetical protein
MPGAPERVTLQPGHCGFCHGNQYSQRIEEDEDEVVVGDLLRRDIAEVFWNSHKKQ